MNRVDLLARMTDQPIKGAYISDCSTYRYALWRSWDVTMPTLTVCMLNPSTADGRLDDPTIRRLIAFAKRDEFGGLFVVNLYAFRATDPAELAKADDPIGPENNDMLILAAQAAAQNREPFLCAWGAYPTIVAGPLVNMVKSFGADTMCLGLTKQGHPRHPLYVDGLQAMVEF